MPCYDDRVGVDRQMAVRLACEYLTRLEAEGRPIPAYAEDWWRDHKAYDEAMGRRPVTPRGAHDSLRRLMELQRQRESDVERYCRELDRKIEGWLRLFKGEN